MIAGKTVKDATFHGVKVWASIYICLDVTSHDEDVWTRSHIVWTSCFCVRVVMIIRVPVDSCCSFRFTSPFHAVVLFDEDRDTHRICGKWL